MIKLQQFIVLLFLVVAQSGSLIVARLVTVDDSLRLGYKVRFKFTDVLSNAKTRSFIKHNTQFATIDELPNITISSYGRIQKTFHSFPNQLNVYVTSHVFDSEEVQAQIQLNNKTYLSTPQLFILEESSKGALPNLQASNVCWVVNYTLKNVSYQATHNIIQSCLQKWQISQKVEEALYSKRENPQEESSFLSFLALLVGCASMVAFSGAKLYLISQKTKSESVV